MKKLDLSNPDNLTMAKVLGTVCEGLAEVCELMFNDPKYAHLNGRELKEYAREFRAFSRWWLREGMIQDERLARRNHTKP